MSVLVIKPGLQTTVQDLGRWGWQDRGVPTAGPMDRASHRLANRLVGNPEDAAALEVTLIGPILEFEEPATVAVTGAEFELRLTGAEGAETQLTRTQRRDGALSMPMNSALRVERGCRLEFRERRRGARAYIAFDGGVDVPPVFGSRATHVPTATGGFNGRALAAGDRLQRGPGISVGASGFSRTSIVAGSSTAPRAEAAPAAAAIDLPSGGARLRALRGPQAPLLDEAAFLHSRFSVSPRSNRMGYRLEGPAVMGASGTMLSEATPPGSVQVLPSGELILLMADVQTAGGYPKIATVISADLPFAGQLAPGDWIEFDFCDRASAMRALAAQERRFLR